MSRGTGSFGKKSSRHGFVAGLFFPRMREKWVIDSCRAYLVYLVAEILRGKKPRYPLWLAPVMFGIVRPLSLLSGEYSEIRSHRRSSRAERHSIGFRCEWGFYRSRSSARGVKGREIERKKNKRDESRKTEKKLSTYWSARLDRFLEPLITLSRWRNCRKPTIVRNFWNHLAANRDRGRERKREEATCRHNCNSHENALQSSSRARIARFCVFRKRTRVSLHRLFHACTFRYFR